MNQPTLSETLYTAADLQGKEAQATPDELRTLGDIARAAEKRLQELPLIVENGTSFAGWIVNESPDFNDIILRYEENLRKAHRRPKMIAESLISCIIARRNCEESGNTLWEEKWTERIKEIMDTAPSGSGFDSGTVLAEGKCHHEKLWFYVDFHHMNEHGYYTEWTQHHVTCSPSFFGIEIKVGGLNRNDIKDYIHEVFYNWLSGEDRTEVPS